VSSEDVHPGAILAGKYRVQRVLGQGGMGVVVEATQLDLERRVALKFLRKSKTAESSVALARFEREARTVARLRGPHVVQVYDVGKLEHGEPFIVMELLDGEDLSSMLERERRLSVPQAVDYLAQTCEAMAEAHVAGVVHRDLKPANLFVARSADGRPLVKVLDFGISKLMSADASSPSLTGGALGSPLYMSPEQLSSSKEIDHRTDVWSLGAILYELVTGVPAFKGDSVPQICTRIMLEQPALPSSFRPDIPADLDKVILTSLQKLPGDRYPSVADLALALLPFARKSSLGSIETAARIVRGSQMPHRLSPDELDSVPPPPAPGGTYSPRPEAATIESDPSFTAEPNALPEAKTVNISGLPGAGTQAELKPLMSPIDEPTAAAASPSRRWLWGALAVLVTAGAGFIALRVRPSAAPPTPAAAELTKPSAAWPAPLVASATPPEHAPESALATAKATAGVAAPMPSLAASAARKPAPAHKAKPAAPRPSEPNPEELLKHR
jgi:eukaryotic-like serine/threonine-protein kinase